MNKDKNNIEKAAIKFSENLPHSSVRKWDFIQGAISDAAKEYWLNVFSLKNKQEIVEYLDKMFWKYKVYEQMPENEEGYETVPFDSLEKIVDGLIPNIKSVYKKYRYSEEDVKEILNKWRKDSYSVTKTILFDKISKEEAYDNWFEENKK